MALTNSPELDFYYFEACPYCQRVITAIKKNNIKVNWLDLHEGTHNLQKLLYVTGKKTVPCLFINGRPMYESLDIIAWLEKNIDQLTKA